MKKQFFKYLKGKGMVPIPFLQLETSAASLSPHATCCVAGGFQGPLVSGVHFRLGRQV